MHVIVKGNKVLGTKLVFGQANCRSVGETPLTPKEDGECELPSICL